MSQILRCVSSLLVCFALGVSISQSRADDSSSPAATNPADESAADRDLFRLIPASSNSGGSARSFNSGYDLGNGQCLGDPCQVNTKFGADPYCRLFPQDRLFQFRGWLDAGILGNAASPSSHFNGPYNSQEVDNGQFNQAYLIMERALASDGSFSFGGRIDLLYGADYFLAQSTGLETNPNGTPRWNSSQYYGLALPQAYAEFCSTSRTVGKGWALLYNCRLRECAGDQQLFLLARLQLPVRRALHTLGLDCDPQNQQQLAMASRRRQRLE